MPSVLCRFVAACKGRERMCSLAPSFGQGWGGCACSVLILMDPIVFPSLAVMVGTVGRSRWRRADEMKDESWEMRDEVDISVPECSGDGEAAFRLRLSTHPPSLPFSTLFKLTNKNGPSVGLHSTVQELHRLQVYIISCSTRCPVQCNLAASTAMQMPRLSTLPQLSRSRAFPSPFSHSDALRSEAGSD